MTREIVADFAIYANTTTVTWGSILGNIGEQTDLIHLLDLKANKCTTINGYSLSSNITLKVSDFQNDRDYQTRLQVNSSISVHNTSSIAHEDIRGLISSINNTMSTFGDIVTHNAAEFVFANNAITAGIATKIAYDEKGLVTAGTTLSASDIPSITLSKISDVTATASEINVLDGITASTAELNYVNGVTSAIQTQLNAKEPKANVTSKGTATLPVYFDSNAVAQTITSYEGNSATATKATQDGNGNVIADTYVNNTRFNALPSYENYTSAQTDTKGLADLKKFNRSTFDLSKFTVVGTPKVTDDGIASDFGSSNYLSVPNTQITTNTPFIIKGSIKTSSDITTNQCSLGINQENATPILIDFRVSGGNINLIYATSSSETSSVVTSCMANTQYEYELKYNGTNLEYYLNGALISTITNFYSANLGYIYLGRSREGAASGYYIPFKGSIDLKQFSVTVDGVEIFNGNKTGVDVIKADNFTKVGSPTISADGIASGFSSSNYLTKTLDFRNATSWKVYIKFKTPNSISSTERILQRSANSTSFIGVAINTSGLLSFINVASSDYTAPYVGFQANTNYLFEFAYESNTYTIKYKKDGDTDFTTILSQPSNAVWDVATLHYIGNGSNTTEFFTGSIDLNAFQIFVDGNLVYQPLLRIPYTQSKTGSKIVQYTYRDRVQDMYNQFGWANYYTLSDTDFTVPYGENLDGHVTKIDWYKNGVTSWEYDTNLDCIETGSCTSETAVTLPKPMADDTYSLSVPYSAKSKTGFTPTATGDYIAKGKVVLG